MFGRAGKNAHVAYPTSSDSGPTRGALSHPLGSSTFHKSPADLGVGLWGFCIRKPGEIPSVLKELTTGAHRNIDSAMGFRNRSPREMLHGVCVVVRLASRHRRGMDQAAPNP